MSFVIPDVGEVQLLKYMLNFAPATNVRLHLFTNNHTPGQTDTLASFTESAVAGYASLLLTGSQWTITTVSNTTTAVYARQTFSFSTGEAVYGLYATNDVNSSLLWSERFNGAPFTIQNTGGTIDIDPVYSLRNE